MQVSKINYQQSFKAGIKVLDTPEVSKEAKNALRAGMDIFARPISIIPQDGGTVYKWTDPVLENKIKVFLDCLKIPFINV